MTKTTFATIEDHQRATTEWYVVDASKHVFGRMASRIAEVLMGKNKPLYTPHISVGAGVIVINAERIGVTGQKRDTRVYTRWTGHVGGLREATLGERIEHEPEKLLKEAVRRMLPKTRLGHDMLRRLKVYRGSEHPHAAQRPVEMDIPC
ncbi:MAG: 50S ribosomal protein L13 [Planctomycetes bacterium]|nr:50S ribosomal protein L13 [Planctomycetota bacterium]